MSKKDSNSFHFKQFEINQDKTAMKVGIDSVLLGSWCPIEDPKHILDIGTGTGILALITAQRSRALVDAVELEDEAFIQSTENCKKSIFDTRIICHHSSIQDFGTDKLYDLIISNPPYFENSLKAKDSQRTAARHTDSLSFDELCGAASSRLRDNGTFTLILPAKAYERIIATAERQGLYNTICVWVKGKSTKEANRILLAFKKEKGTTQTSTLCIRECDGKYSDDFKSMTQDLYLDSIFR